MNEINIRVLEKYKLERIRMNEYLDNVFTFQNIF